LPSTAFVNNILAHSNYSYVAYGDHIVGKLENLKLTITKDVEYDVIIGSGGRPFGEPIIKTMKFGGSFTKGMLKISELDKVLMLDSIGNDHADWRSEHDSSDFSSANLTKFIDLNNKSLTILPIAFDTFTISLGGIVLSSQEIEIVHNKYIRINANYIGKHISYYNKTDSQQFNEMDFREQYPWQIGDNSPTLTNP